MDLRQWRLLDTGPRTAAENMALERVLLTARERDWTPDTLHFLQFKPHCVLVGYHQNVSLEVEEQYCRDHGLDINRRISGGGCIYMDESQLGWELIARKGTPGIPGRLEDMYRLLCEGAVRGFRKLGVDARYRPLNDIEVDGRKISGTGGTEDAQAFIFHGTVLTDFDIDTMLQSIKLPVKKLEDKQIQSFRQRVVSLRELLGAAPPIGQVKQAMADGMAEALGIELCPGPLAAAEEELLAAELPRFQSEAWIRGGRDVPDADLLRTVDYKAKGGLIRITLLLNGTRQRIRSIFITGDFFAYPERGILDLEAALKNTSCEPERLNQNIRQFFERQAVQIPGVTADDFVQAILRAIGVSGAQ